VVISAQKKNEKFKNTFPDTHALLSYALMTSRGPDHWTPREQQRVANKVVFLTFAVNFQHQSKVELVVLLVGNR